MGGTVPVYKCVAVSPHSKGVALNPLYVMMYLELYGCVLLLLSLALTLPSRMSKHLLVCTFLQGFSSTV